MKCLAKTAEDRYQTAAGLAADLKRCLAEWEADGAIAPFTPGAHDIPDVLRIPEKLYGREAEVARLLEAFDRVVADGAPELVLVSGYSGVGKSSVVNELHKALVPPRGLFAAGKFDQYKRDIPYSTLAQAFQGLIRRLLGQSEAELDRWREALRAALEPNAALDRQPGPRPEADPRRAAAGSGPAAAGRGTPLPAGAAALHRRVRAAGASAGAVPGRPAVAGRGDPGPARRSDDPAGRGIAAAGRRLPRQRGGPDPSA